MSQFLDPKFQFDGYDEHEDAEYRDMMPFILAVESIQAKALGAWLREKLKPASVIDLGCGPGLYLLPYKEAGARVLGLDACSTAGGCLEEGEFLRWDLRFPYVAENRFDLAICTEVFEHLHEHWEDRLVDTLWDCADTLLISWAVPGQGGSFHVNERSHEYVLAKFKERHNYVVHPLNSAMHEFLEQFRPEEARGEVSGWLLNNSFLLHRTKYDVKKNPWKAPK